MNHWAKELEGALPAFEKGVETIDASFPELVKFIEEPTNEADKAGIANTRQKFSEFAPQARTGAESFRSLQETVAGLKGISKDMNRASRRLAQVIGSIILHMERVEAFAVRAVALIDGRFESVDANSDETTD
jgi:hypothetical protein